MSELWDRAADRFDRWTQSLWTPLAIPLVDAAALQPGEAVFDACCGTGASAFLAAKAVGSAGVVTAVDLSTQMISAAQNTARLLDVPQLSFKVSDVLTSKSKNYDAVLCGFGVFFLGEPAVACESLSSRLRPGGRLVLSVWQGRPFSSLTKVVLAACEAEGGPRQVASASARNIGKINTEAKLIDVLNTAGLSDITVSEIPFSVPLTPESAWDFVLSSLLIAALPTDPHAVERVRQRLIANWCPLNLEADAFIGCATKP